MMITSVSSADRRLMAAVVLTAQQANTVTVTVIASASGAVHHQQGVVVRTVRIERMRSKINFTGGGDSPLQIQRSIIMHSEKFTHNGVSYEVRVIYDGESVYVKAFQGNRPANRFRYSATIELVQDMAAVLGTDAVKHLIEIAKQDLITGLK